MVGASPAGELVGPARRYGRSPPPPGPRPAPGSLGGSDNGVGSGWRCGVRVVVALGGNALSPTGGTGSAAEMRAALAGAAEALADLVGAGAALVLTHGNGPQVGRILLQQEAAAPEVPPMPMDVCGAESQGQIGYLLAQALGNALRARGLPQRVFPLITQVVVDGRDPAFRRPTKPVGPAYDAATAQGIATASGHVFGEVTPGALAAAGRLAAAGATSSRPSRCGWSPAPGTCWSPPAAAGCRWCSTARSFRGVEAVVDKDRTAARLALLVGRRRAGRSSPRCRRCRSAGARRTARAGGQADRHRGAGAAGRRRVPGRVDGAEGGGVLRLRGRRRAAGGDRRAGRRGRTWSRAGPAPWWCRAEPWPVSRRSSRGPARGPAARGTGRCR